MKFHSYARIYASSWRSLFVIAGIIALVGIGASFLAHRKNEKQIFTETTFFRINPLASAQSAEYKTELARETAQLLACPQKDGSQIECINATLRDVARSFGARFALDVIEPLAQKPEFQYLLTHSHDLSHTAGNFALEHNYGLADQKEGKHVSDEILIQRIGKALVDCDGWGAFGCYHGVIEAGLSRLSPMERTRVVRKACLENPLIQSKQYYTNQCIHWFGHGMTIFTNQTLTETLAICEGLADNWGSDEVQLCLSGVFHAGSVPGSSDVDLLANIARVYRNTDVYYPCRDLPERLRGQCFSHIPGRTGVPDMDKVFKNCDNLPEQDPAKKRNYIHRCYNSGANILLVNMEFNAEKVVNECRTFAAPAYRKYCYEGAVRYWILRDPLLNNRGPFEVCERAEPEAKSICYRGLGAANNENYFSPEILETYCDQITEPEYAADCRALHIPD